MQPSRRQVLLAAGVATAATAAACTADKPLRPSVPSAKDALRSDAVARERELVDAYSASLSRHPAQRTLLAAILGDHAAHLAALTATATPSPTATASPTLPQPLSLGQLAALETKAARDHADACVRAGADCDAGSLALLLASLAACEASHAALL